MDRIFGDLPFCFVYLDDILVYSSSLANHQLHLCCVLNLCRLHGLTINLENCVFAASQVEYLGHSVSANHPALQQFLGMVNFYRKFIHRAALILRPLTDALRGDLKDFSWSPQMDSAFISTKSALSLMPTLVHPDPSAQVSLAEFSVPRPSFSPWKLDPGKILFPLIDSSLFLDLSLVLNSLLGAVRPLPPPWFLRLWFRILA